MFANFRLQKLIGEGLTGKVYLAEDSINGDTVALKVMHPKKQLIQEQGKVGFQMIERMLENERRTLTYIENKAALAGVVGVKSMGHWKGMPYIAMEYCPKGELFDVLDERQKFSEREALIVFKRLVKTISALHDIGVIHRDLKLQNIVMGRDELDPRICDFGVAKLVGEEDFFKEVAVGSAGYNAPETFSFKYDKCNDIWSLGCILYNLVSGEMPFDPDDPLLRIRVLQNRFEFDSGAWVDVDDSIKDLIKKMLSPRDKRPTAREVLSHSCFNLLSRVQEEALHTQQERPAQKSKKEQVDDPEKVTLCDSECSTQNVLFFAIIAVIIIRYFEKVYFSLVHLYCFVSSFRLTIWNSHELIQTAEASTETEESSQLHYIKGSLSKVVITEEVMMKFTFILSLASVLLSWGNIILFQYNKLFIEPKQPKSSSSLLHGGSVNFEFLECDERRFYRDKFVDYSPADFHKAQRVVNELYKKRQETLRKEAVFADCMKCFEEFCTRATLIDDGRIDRSKAKEAFERLLRSKLEKINSSPTRRRRRSSIGDILVIPLRNFKVVMREIIKPTGGNTLTHTTHFPRRKSIRL